MQAVSTPILEHYMLVNMALRNKAYTKGSSVARSNDSLLGCNIANIRHHRFQVNCSSLAPGGGARCGGAN